MERDRKTFASSAPSSNLHFKCGSFWVALSWSLSASEIVRSKRLLVSFQQRFMCTHRSQQVLMGEFLHCYHYERVQGDMFQGHNNTVAVSSCFDVRITRNRGRNLTSTLLSSYHRYGWKKSIKDSLDGICVRVCQLASISVYVSDSRRREKVSRSSKEIK